MRALTFGFSVFFLMTASVFADQCTSPANIVTNCGFETGTFAGWNLSGVQSTAAFEGVSHGIDTTDAHTGTYGAYLAGFGGYLSVFQSFATVPNDVYLISYFLAHAPATPAPYTSGFSTIFNGTTLFSAGNAPDLPYTHYQFTISATSSFSTLAFNARDDTGFFSLDDIGVSMVGTPEPRMSLLLLVICSAILWYQRRQRSAVKN